MEPQRTNAARTAPPEARRGWIFEIEQRHDGAPTTAEILDVLDVPGYTEYRVRWGDGSESIFLPAAGTHAHPVTRESPLEASAQPGPMPTMRRSSA
jgi:Domain of unknown function (DUF1918)